MKGPFFADCFDAGFWQGHGYVKNLALFIYKKIVSSWANEKFPLFHKDSEEFPSSPPSGTSMVIVIEDINSPAFSLKGEGENSAQSPTLAPGALAKLPPGRVAASGG
ncbi:MAG: hypothetical protein V3U37_00580 [Nitrospinaceae bacterium]